VRHWPGPAAGGLAAPEEDHGQPRHSISWLWRKFCLQPHRAEGFTFCTGPQPRPRSATSSASVCTLPTTRWWVCADEKSQCQALERAQPILPVRPGIAERQTHDYARHGVTCLFAALDAATGQVTDACNPRHQEFLTFLTKLAAACPGTELHVVCGNYATHKLGRNPPVAGQAAEQADHLALHAGRLLVDQPRGVLLLRDHPPGHPPRLLHLRQAAHRRHHRPLERLAPALRLDQGRRRDPRQHQPRQD
jgi:hypothetical protein